MEATQINVSKGQTNPPASQVTAHNRSAILEATEDAMDIIAVVNTQHTQKTPPPPLIFIDDVIEIKTMTETIEKEISKEEYKLKISNNRVKILPTNLDAYRKLTKLLKTLNANFHTYQLKEERSFRVVLRNIHHSADLDELKFELLKHGHEVTNISNIRHRITENPLSLYFIDIKQKKKKEITKNSTTSTG